MTPNETTSASEPSDTRQTSGWKDGTGHDSEVRPKRAPRSGDSKRKSLARSPTASGPNRERRKQATKNSATSRTIGISIGVCLFIVASIAITLALVVIWPRESDFCLQNPEKFCPNGICYTSTCYSDIHSFIPYYWKAKCSNATQGLCQVTCDEFLAVVCRNPHQPPRFCGDRLPLKYGHFACQLGNEYKDLHPDEAEACLKDIQCVAMKALYPCIAGYVQHGRLLCSRKCVLPGGHTGKALSIFGYCIWKKDSCTHAMEGLMESIGGNDIGYSFSMTELNASSNWPNDTATIEGLTYPFMLAYTILVERHIIDDDPLSNSTSISDFIESLNREENLKTLTGLFVNEHNIVDTLRRRAQSALHRGQTVVADDRWLRIADAIINYECHSFQNCPPIEGAKTTIRQWSLNAVRECLLSGVMFSSTAKLDMAWYEAITYMRQATCSVTTISLINPEGFACQMHQRARQVLQARNLQDETFEDSVGLCNTTQTVSPEHDVVLPLKFDVAFVRPGSISSFALVLASARSVQRAICQMDGNSNPSVDCELQLYLAFRAFMPPPSEVETKLLDTTDIATVYFVLRAVRRRQVAFGTTESPFDRFNKETTDIVEIKRVAGSLAAECLQTLR